ncbi:hypothetical protein ACFXJ8_35640 [Nonomuraea sp. NPDC059194]|uniref:hypothetical protein n=1 Tax=Nonomuraea sp. NPDC059194 TaxID=3346764 RepID=UPI00367F21CC
MIDARRRRAVDGGPAAMADRVAVGHAPDGSVVRPWMFSRASGPAGSTLCSTAADLARFGELFVGAGASVLSAEACAAMQVPQVPLLTRRFADR